MLGYFTFSENLGRVGEIPWQACGKLETVVGRVHTKERRNRQSTFLLEVFSLDVVQMFPVLDQ